jgi:hypothetical protein
VLNATEKPDAHAHHRNLMHKSSIETKILQEASLHHKSNSKHQGFLHNQLSLFQFQHEEEVKDDLRCKTLLVARGKFRTAKRIKSS